MDTNNNHENKSLTNDPQEMLKMKHAADQHKAEFTNFARSVSGEAPVDHGQASPIPQREPDQQNNMKDQENRMGNHTVS